MDWLTFISKAIESLAWPIVALILGLVFRRKLLDLLPSIRKLKAGPVEAEFELATKQVLANASEAGSHSTVPNEKPSDPNPQVPKETIERLINARNDPAGVILEGWAKVDGELFRLATQLGLVVDPLENTQKVYQAIMSSNLLPGETQRLVRELRELRNKVAHVAVRPTAEAAQDYLLAVDRVVELISNYRKNLPNYGSKNRPATEAGKA